MSSRHLAELRPDLKVHLYYGVPGSGKTLKAFVENDDMYRKMPGTLWFDGYDGQKVLLLDDFCGAASKMRLDYFLSLIDKFPFMVEVKGATTWLQATKIIVTSNIHPHHWWEWLNREVMYDALKRRFDKVFYFPTKTDVPQEVTAESFWDDWRLVAKDQCLITKVFDSQMPNDRREYGLVLSDDDVSDSEDDAVTTVSIDDGQHGDALSVIPDVDHDPCLGQYRCYCYDHKYHRDDIVPMCCRCNPGYSCSPVVV